jgi:hypothetical protein
MKIDEGAKMANEYVEELAIVILSIGLAVLWKMS